MKSQIPDQERELVTIDMVNDKETRDRIHAIFNVMCDAVPDDATSPEVATVCFMVLSHIAACHQFDPLVVEDLKHNLDTSLQQAEVQWQAKEALLALHEAEVKGNG